MIHLLIFGGTKEARLLAQSNQGWPELLTTISLASLCDPMQHLTGRVRHGGFESSSDLAIWLRKEKIDAVIDASHPFATRISHQAALACSYTNTPRLGLYRPSFSCLDCHYKVADLPAALAALPLRSHVLLTTGSRGLAALDTRPDCHFLIRMLTQPQERPHKAAYRILRGLPTTNYHQERALMITHGITALIAKDSGGQEGIIKLRAAHSLSLPVWLITRPPPPPPPFVASIAEAQTWLKNLIARKNQSCCYQA